MDGKGFRFTFSESTAVIVKIEVISLEDKIKASNVKNKLGVRYPAGIRELNVDQGIKMEIFT